MAVERPIFGDPESQKRAKTLPRARKEIHPTEYDLLRALPTIERLVEEEIERWGMLRREGLDGETLAREILGFEEYSSIRPSLVSKCLRWWGYSELGFKGVERNLNTILRLESGLAIHRALEKLLKRMGPIEYQIIRPKEGGFKMSGTIDILFENPRLVPEVGNFQVVELKSVSSEAFRYQLNRKRLRRDLTPVENIVAPRESDKKQVGLYMKWLEDEGKKVACANIIYIDRNNLNLKEALIPWDAITKYEIDQLDKQIEEARRLIEQGKLPEATVDSDIPCRYYCDYRLVCDVGRPAVVKRKEPIPRKVRAIAKKERERKRKIMEEQGSVQPTLGGAFERLVYKEK